MDPGDIPHAAQTKSSTAANAGEGFGVPSIPDHQLLCTIGRGAYGEVWLARNSLGAYRAVKVVYRKSFTEQRPFEREWSGIRKFEPISRSHEGFIDVLHAGMNQAEGYFYYVMELGDDQKSGQTINPDTYKPKTLSREISASGKLSFHDSLQLGLTLSQALAELHKRDLVHRDIKPSNIIFVNGVAKLADIGLVADVNEARSYVGTEGFIPPEGPGAPQADVYGLGKVLYEASTGKDRQDFPELPTLVYDFEEREKFLELNEVILKACRPDCLERYPNAWEMHADLVVLANGKSVKRLHALERRLAALKRAGTLSVVVALGVATVGYLIYRNWRSAFEERQRQVGASVAYGMQSVDNGDLLGSLPYFAEALKLQEGNPERELVQRLRFGSTLAQCPKLVRVWSSFTKRPAAAEFSPDGKRVAVAEYEGNAYVYDLQNGQPCCAPLNGPDGLSALCFSPDGRFLAASGEKGSIFIWDAGSFQKLSQFDMTNNELHSVSFSPDSSRVVSAGSDGVVGVWNVLTGKKELGFNHGSHQLEFACYNHKGNLLVTASDDKTVQLWNATNGQRVGNPLKHGSWVKCAAFSPDDQKLATACLDRKARVWDVSGNRILSDMNHIDGVEYVSFSPDGRMILTACWDGTARLWRAGDLQPVTFNPVFWHGDRVRHVAWNNDGSQLVTCCMDHSVRVWDLAGRICFPTAVPGSPSEDGTRVVEIATNSLIVRETLSGRQVCATIHPQGVVDSTELSQDKRVLLGISLEIEGTVTNRLVNAWDTQTGHSAGPTLSFSNGWRLVLSPDGQYLAATVSNLTQVWNVKTGTPLSSPLTIDASVTLARFSPDGSRLATAAGTNVWVWATQTGNRLFNPLPHVKPVYALAFSPDGSLLATGCLDYSVDPCYAQIWDAATGRPKGPRLEHKDGVMTLVFSSDGRRLVTGSEDYTATVWGTKTGQPLLHPLRHSQQVEAVAFDSQNKWLATASIDGILRIWDTETGDALTPPLRQFGLVRNPDDVWLGSLTFGGDRFHVITEDEDEDGRGGVNQWILEKDTWPVADVSALAQLLSSGEFHSAAGFKKNPESPESVWKRLCNRYQSQFLVLSEDLARWHDLEAQQSDLEAQQSDLEVEPYYFSESRAAEVFHLEHLLALHPGDASVIARLNGAKAKLKTEH